MKARQLRAHIHIEANGCEIDDTEFEEFFALVKMVMNEMNCCATSVGLTCIPSINPSRIISTGSQEGTKGFDVFKLITIQSRDLKFAESLAEHIQTVLEMWMNAKRIPREEYFVEIMHT